MKHRVTDLNLADARLARSRVFLKSLTVEERLEIASELTMAQMDATQVAQLVQDMTGRDVRIVRGGSIRADYPD